MQPMLTIVVIAIGMVVLAGCGHTALSRTSRAAAYVTLADLIEGTVWKRGAWPKALLDMLVTLLIHALGVVVFVALSVYGLYIVLQRLGIDLKPLL